MATPPLLISSSAGTSLILAGLRTLHDNCKLLEEQGGAAFGPTFPRHANLYSVMMVLAPIFWHVDGFSCGPFNFILEVTGIKDKQAKYPEFILMKSRPLVLDYIENLKNVEVSNILELGIMKGGSCAMFEALYRPSCHMAIDVYKHDHDGLAELEKYVASFKRRFKAHYDVSQADIPRIMSEWNSLTGQKSLDIIIDDASHCYSLSIASFNGLFPHLRPGGVYVIEDWGWAHWNGPWQDTTHPEFNSPALSNLSIHCVIRTTALALESDRYHRIISKVISTADQTFVFRGDAAISETFDVRQNVPMRGRKPFLLQFWNSATHAISLIDGREVVRTTLFPSYIFAKARDNQWASKWRHQRLCLR